MNPIKWLRARLQEWELRGDEIERLKESKRHALEELQARVERGECDDRLDTIHASMTMMIQDSQARMMGRRVAK